MRKILFTFVCLAIVAVGAQAQKLGFVNKDGVVDDGSTVVCEAQENPILEIVRCATGSLALKNYTTEDISCTVTVSLIDNTIGVMPQICMGGQCSPITAWPFTRSFICSASKSVLAQYDADPQNYGELNSKMTVTGGGETHTVYIKFVYSDPAGISSIQTACLYDVFDMSGHLLLEKVDGKTLSSSKRGLYIVRSLNDGKYRKVAIK